jgi:putative transposase
MDYAHVGRSKFLLIYHIVLVTKFRRKVLDKIGILEIMKEIESRSDFVVIEQEFESDHIHMMIKLLPRYSISSLVRRIKMISTNLSWLRYSEILKKYYWKKKNLWSNGFFACTIGNASIETIRRYIQEQ